MTDRSTSPTITEDEEIGIWLFTLQGHAIEVEPRHGYVKINGTLHHSPRLEGLQRVTDLQGAPLDAILALLPNTPARPPPESPQPVTKKPPPQPTPHKTRTAELALSSVEPSSSIDNTVLATPDAATYLGLSPKTLETSRVRGGGPPFVKLGRRVVYRKGDLDAWLAERVRKSTSHPGRSGKK